VSADPLPSLPGWTPLTPGWEPAEELALARVELLDELVHPVRGAIVRWLREPRTVADLAELLDVPVTRLYHHIKRLEADGLIRVEATRRVGAVTERRYRVTARRFEVPPALLDQHDRTSLGRAVGGLFDVTKVALQREFEIGTFTSTSIEEQLMVSLAELHLDDDRRTALLTKLRELLEEFTDGDQHRDEGSSGDADRAPFRLFVAAFPETR
jgi:DNA-binding transcriptional ArsR family regulator